MTIKGGGIPTAEKTQIKIILFLSIACAWWVTGKENQDEGSLLSFPDAVTGTQRCVRSKSVVHNVSLLNINFCTCSQGVPCTLLLGAWSGGEGECYKQSRPVCHWAVLLLTEQQYTCVSTSRAVFFQCHSKYRIEKP